MGNSLVLTAYVKNMSATQPGAIGIGYAEGWRHQIIAELRRRERRREIRVLWAHLREKPGGLIYVPVSFLKTPAQIRMARLRRVLAVAGPALVLLAGMLWALWSIRELILTGLGVAGALALLCWLLPHWSNGCPGLHCAGCKG